MKKYTLEAIRNYLNGDTTIDLDALRKEIDEEYNRITAKSRANADIYAAAHDTIFNASEWDKPMTVKEIYAAIEAELPADFSANKMQYGFLNYWAAEVVKHDNGKNPYTYSKA